MAIYGPSGHEELYHYGIKRRSGRYPFGSGENPYQSVPSMQKKTKTYGDLSLLEKAKLKRARKQKAKAAEKAQEEAARKAAAEKAAEAKKTATEKAKEMTDEELYVAIQRLRLEQTYANLVRDLDGGQKIQNGQQNQNSQSQQPQQQSNSTKEKSKKWIDKTVDTTKKYADLSTNIGNIAKGANTAYASAVAISKLAKQMAAVAEAENKKK